MTKPVIIVHGGAGDWPRARRNAGLRGVQAAATRGFELLGRKGSALDAVEEAVVSMEDNSVFNAGTGSTLNLLGTVEADAAIMDGKTLQAGSVAMVQGVKNPVRLARLVMEKTDHVLLGGAGARRLAQHFHLPQAKLVVGSRVNRWRREKAAFRKGAMKHLAKNRRLVKEGDGAGKLDTVGALAIDYNGNLAAACSTGGLSLKLPGRIGDTAIIGSGLYADNAAGAATATGIGEIAMRLIISKTATDLMKHSPAEEAAVRAVKLASKRIGKGLGIVTLDRRGKFTAAHNTRNLCWAVAQSQDPPEARIFGRRV